MSKGKTSYVNPDESIKKNIAMENTAKDLKFEDANFDSLKFENAETGQFEFAKMTEEGDTFTGFVLQDCEKDFPSWLPEKIEPKCYVMEDTKGKRFIISKFYSLSIAVEKYGMGKTIVYRITRGEKTGDGQSDFVKFDIKIASING